METNEEYSNSEEFKKISDEIVGICLREVHSKSLPPIEDAGIPYLTLSNSRLMQKYILSEISNLIKSFAEESFTVGGSRTVLDVSGGDLDAAYDIGVVDGQRLMAKNISSILSKLK